MAYGADSGPTPESSLPVGSVGGRVLLNDLPVDQPTKDLLGMRNAAEGITKMLSSSAKSSPLVVAIDADWGMGKSTLLRQVEAKLKPPSARRRDKKDHPFRTVWFNAWTAEGGDALAGLIKSVLAELDPNIIRRALRKLIRRKRLMGAVGIVLTVAGRLAGVNRLTDELWTRLCMDAQSRNELRDDIAAMLTKWTGKSPEHAKRRMVVFIDDLDRCSDDVVVKVCEAVKLYLDVPGLIFVLACAQSVLARGVQYQARGGRNEARSYLEKIVQVQYRLPPPGDEAIKDLINGYVEESKTLDLITGEMKTTLAKNCGRNPRKIKRIINTLILESELSPGWREPLLGSDLLLIAILLQHFYEPFYGRLRCDDESTNPISVVLDYAEVRGKLNELKPLEPALISLKPELKQSLARQGVHPSEAEEKEPTSLISLLDERQPEGFTALVGNQRFLALLRSIPEESREPFLRQLRSHPLVIEPPQQLSLGNNDGLERVAVVISRRGRVRTDVQGNAYGEVGGTGQYDSDRGVWPVGKHVRENARYAIIAVDGTVRRVYEIDDWDLDPSGKWEFRATGDRECTAAEIDAAYAAGDLPLRPGDDYPTRAGGAYRPYWF